MHSLFPNSHSKMGRQSDTAGERSGAGPTALRAFRGTGVSHHQLPNSGLLLRNSLIEKPNNTFDKILIPIILSTFYFDLEIEDRTTLSSRACDLETNGAVREKLVY